jgi:hypothetical protein
MAKVQHARAELGFEGRQLVAFGGGEATGICYRPGPRLYEESVRACAIVDGGLLERLAPAVGVT